MYENRNARDDSTSAFRQESLGQSEAFLAFQEKLSMVAKVDRPILIIGERGTGKELAARRLHYLSKRWQEPLVELNCAALAPGLIEAELFGHEAGAFTGAVARRRGRFEGADGGTLFLDELGNLPLSVQEKVLRVVEYGEFQRVGSTESIRVDARIVGATNANLVQRCEEGRFMRDLLDRLSFEVLYLPPLRERQEDIMLLANHFAARMSHELGRTELPEFSTHAVAALETHTWRGNVRELKNVVERAVYQAPGARISHLVFDPFQSPYAQPPSAKDDAAPKAPAPAAVSLDRPFKEAVESLERELLYKALDCARYNQREAAQLLGLSYHQFRGIYRKYGDKSEN